MNAKNTSNEKPFYITTAIDYVNGAPHVGHGFEKVQTDCFARFQRSCGTEVRYLTGSDENSIKNVQAAQKQGITTQELVDTNAAIFENLRSLLNLSTDDFIRTTQKRHFDGAKKFWQTINPDDLYKKDYTGLYCDGCEEFKQDKDLEENGDCPEHAKPPKEIHEENWFFRLSRYSDMLLDLIESDTLKIYPEFRKNEVVSFIKGGLEDFSISRSNERAKNWGVSVPGDDTQMMYVWVDALANYITALDYGESESELYTKYWNHAERVHVIGKGILRFHAIYWPAMLLSARLPIPNKVYAHEYFTVEGKKMSKSLGNVLPPEDLVKRYGTDGARYVLLTSMPYTKDGDLSYERTDALYNADLANGLGNLTSRIITLAGDIQYEVPTIDKRALAKDMDEFNVPAALEKIWKIVDRANKLMEEKKPWTLKKKEDKLSQVEFTELIERFLQDLHILATLLTPFLPETSEKIFTQLETRKKEILFERVK